MIFATPGIVMATVFVSLPLVIREIVPVLEEIGIEQEQAAHSLGASALQTFRRITLPSIKWAIVYGVVLTLARSLGEFGAVKVVSGNILGQTRTATLVVEEKYLNFDQGGRLRHRVPPGHRLGRLHRHRRDHPAQGPRTRKASTHEHRSVRTQQELR